MNDKIHVGSEDLKACLIAMRPSFLDLLRDPSSASIASDVAARLGRLLASDYDRWQCYHQFFEHLGAKVDARMRGRWPRPNPASPRTPSESTPPPPRVARPDTPVERSAPSDRYSAHERRSPSEWSEAEARAALEQAGAEPAVQRITLEWLRAVHEDTELYEKPDRTAWDHLVDDRSSYDNWARQLREGREVLGLQKHRPRVAGRSRSMIRVDEQD
ncbi:MAG: hypothetical protein EPO65_04030 [Dehalococcoidia bacterium]|nr:MAG: hypothetical protein EPO65_04030 [Dehalococcoidia bacterium]